MNIVDQANAWALEIERETVRRIGTIGIVCGVDHAAAKAIYERFFAAAKHAATTTFLSLDEALTGGWEVYRKALIGRTEAYTAQAAAEKWFTSEAIRRRSGF